MGAPTWGMQIAAIMQFFAIMMMLSSIVSITVPHAAVVSFYGTNGIVNSTYSAYINKFSVPVLTTANSSTGFGAYGSNTASSNAFLSFIYGGLGLLWKSMLNLPNMIIVIFSGLAGNIYFLPSAFIIVSSTVIGIAGIIGLYVTIGNFFKTYSSISKTDQENIGA